MDIPKNSAQNKKHYMTAVILPLILSISVFHPAQAETWAEKKARETKAKAKGAVNTAVQVAKEKTNTVVKAPAEVISLIETGLASAKQQIITLTKIKKDLGSNANPFKVKAKEKIQTHINKMQKMPAVKNVEQAISKTSHAVNTLQLEITKDAQQYLNDPVCGNKAAMSEINGFYTDQARNFKDVKKAAAISLQASNNVLSGLLEVAPITKLLGKLSAQYPKSADELSKLNQSMTEVRNKLKNSVKDEANKASKAGIKVAKDNLSLALGAGGCALFLADGTKSIVQALGWGTTAAGSATVGAAAAAPTALVGTAAATPAATVSTARTVTKVLRAGFDGVAGTAGCIYTAADVYKSWKNDHEYFNDIKDFAISVGNLSKSIALATQEAAQAGVIIKQMSTSLGGNKNNDLSKLQKHISTLQSKVNTAQNLMSKDVVSVITKLGDNVMFDLADNTNKVNMCWHKLTSVTKQWPKSTIDTTGQLAKSIIDLDNGRAAIKRMGVVTGQAPNQAANKANEIWNIRKNKANELITKLGDSRKELSAVLTDVSKAKELKNKILNMANETNVLKGQIAKIPTEAINDVVNNVLKTPAVKKLQKEMDKTGKTIKSYPALVSKLNNIIAKKPNVKAAPVLNAKPVNLTTINLVKAM